MIIGYARVSTQEQNLNRQIDLLKSHNCDEVLLEKASGKNKDRPQLTRLLDKVRAGDTVIVESFNRLARSTKDLIDIVELLQSREIVIVSLKENFDTRTPQGRLMLTMFSAFAQFERELIVERTKEGLAAARARGRKGGRKPVDSKKLEQAIKMYKTKEFTLAEIEKSCGISRATIYRNL